MGLLEHARRFWHLNHIPAVCMYVVPFVRFLFNGNNRTFCNWKIVWIMSVWETWKIQIVLDSFFNPRNKKSRFQVFIFVSNVCPLYFHITYLFRSCIYPTPRHHCPLINLRAPFSLFRVTKTLTFKTTQNAKLFLGNLFSFALEQKIIFISITLHLQPCFETEAWGKSEMVYSHLLSEKSLDCGAVSRLSRSQLYYSKWLKVVLFDILPAL